MFLHLQQLQLRLLTSVEQFLQPLVRRSRNDLGQATAEYALVLLGAATIALLLVAWAAGSGKIGQLFDAVFDHLLGKVG